MSNHSTLVFDGHDFRIVQADIVAAIGDPYWCDTYNHGNEKTISWSIRFLTETDDEGLLAPSVDFDALEIVVPNWHNLTGYQAKWTQPINKATDERYGLTYVYDHQLITAGNLEIVEREGDLFHVLATGENEDGQTFSIDAWARFLGISVRGSECDTDDTIRNRLKQFIDDANLRGSAFQLKGKYESGVRMGESFFTPKPDASGGCPDIDCNRSADRSVRWPVEFIDSVPATNFGNSSNVLLKELVEFGCDVTADGDWTWFSISRDDRTIDFVRRGRLGYNRDYCWEVRLSSEKQPVQLGMLFGIRECACVVITGMKDIRNVAKTWLDGNDISSLLRIATFWNKMDAKEPLQAPTT